MIGLNKKKITRKVIYQLASFTAILLCCTLIAEGQKRINFSGIWVLKQRVSVSGTDYINGVPGEIRLLQKADSILIERKESGLHGEEINSTENIGFDGKPAITTTHSNNKKASIIRWDKEEQNFTETSDISAQGDERANRRVSYSWSLSNDGNTLTIFKTDENLISGENWSMKGEYEKK